jgi:hypothetical protein
MMNKSLLGCGRESSHKAFYGFHELRSFDNRREKVRFRVHSTIDGKMAKKEPPFPAALK